VHGESIVIAALRRREYDWTAQPSTAKTLEQELHHRHAAEIEKRFARKAARGNSRGDNGRDHAHRTSKMCAI
jgi:hypothetical protein